MRRALCLIAGAALSGLLCACQQTLRLNDLAADDSGHGGGSGSGGSGANSGSGGGSEGGTGDGPMDASIGDGHCSGSQAISFVADVPQVILALDQSTGTTMIDSTSGSSEFLSAVADLSTIVSRYQPNNGSKYGGAGVTIVFYYLAFPSDGSDCNGAPACCASDVTPPLTSQSFQNAAYACSSPGGDCVSSSKRPIAAALQAAESTFGRSGEVQSGPRFVLLVTGGSPPPVPDCFTPSDCQSAINAVDTLRTLKGGKVTTYIVGMGAQSDGGYQSDASDTDCLAAMANDEGSPDYYIPSASRDPLSALMSATGQIALTACNGTLSMAVSSFTQLNVTYQGTQVSPGDFKNGWTLDANGSTPRFSLHGSVCQSFIKNPYDLQISTTCASPHP